MRSFLFSISFLLLFSIHALAQPGTLDPSFGNGGSVITDFADPNNADDIGNKVLTQQDDKILILGRIGYNDVLMRYSKNGIVDSSFGTNGISKLPVISFDFNLQHEKKIIVGGSINSFAICRIDSNGIIDSSFGINGITETVIGFSGRINSITIKKDSTIVATGYIRRSVLINNINYTKYSVALAKYNKEGILDSSFGDNGIVLTDWGINDDFSYALKIQEDGKIVVGGFSQVTVNNITDFPFTLGRYNANGSIDSSFGNDGKLITDISGIFYSGCDLDINNNKEIIVSGTYNKNNDYSNTDFLIFKVDSSGQFSTSFGLNGKLLKDLLGFSEYSGSFAMGIDKGGKILQVGKTFDGVKYNLAMIKYNSDGTIDNSFGINGTTISSFGNKNDDAKALVFQSDGKIVVVGSTNNNSNNDLLIARYDNDITLPITLSSFTASKKQNSVLLNWQTASESNNSYFAIERSNNNSNFKELGKVNSKGNSTQVQQYSFEDQLPLNGANYYRLKQVNKDGSSTNSKTVLVDFSKATVVKIYPNPVKNVITIEGLTGKKTNISIIDLNGRVLTTTSTNDLTYIWNIKALPQGTYYLRTEADKKVNTIKFIKE